MLWVVASSIFQVKLICLGVVYIWLDGTSSLLDSAFTNEIYISNVNLKVYLSSAHFAWRFDSGNIPCFAKL